MSVMRHTLRLFSSCYYTHKYTYFTYIRLQIYIHYEYIIKIETLLWVDKDIGFYIMLVSSKSKKKIVYV